MLAALCLTLFAIGDSFQPHLTREISTQCSAFSSALISGDKQTAEYDRGQGGVRLAEESAIKLTGKVSYKPGEAEAEIDDMIRYKRVAPIQESDVGGTIIAKGVGKEDYQDPGETTEQVIILGPDEAVRDALSGAASAMGYESIVVNFAGGNDLIPTEVKHAMEKMLLSLDIETRTKISFNSLSDASFPLGEASVTVVGLKPDKVGGEVYYFGDQYWTTLDADIETAVTS